MTVRRQYAGAASAQTLTAPMTSITGAATLSGSTGWPSGSTGPFSVVVNRGNATEEKMLCLSVSGTALTIQQRGYDGTSAFAHSASETIEVCATSVDFDEANAHTSASVGVHGLTGAVVGTTDIQTLAGKTLVAPTITDHTNAQHTHLSVSQGGVVRPITGITSSAAVTYSGTPTIGGASTTACVIPHGLPFTPAQIMVGYYNVNSSYTPYFAHFEAADSTNVYISFFTSTGAATSPTSLTVRLIAYA